MAIPVWRTLILVGATAALMPAQQGTVAGPMSGYAFDSAAHALRPILGIPGASSMGDPVAFTFDAVSATVSPAQDSAFLAASDGGLHVVRLSAGTAVERTIDGLSAAPERIWYSPSGTAAALYSAGKVQIVTGLPDSPVLAGATDLGGAASALAISDDGAYLLFAAAGSIRLRGTGVAQATDDRKLMDSGDGALVAFAPKGVVAAVSDPAGVGVALFRDLIGGSQPGVLAAPDDTTASPVGLSFSADGNKLFLASSTARSVSTFDLQTGDRTAVGCGCTPAGLSSMGNLFRLTEPGPDPLWLFDAGAAEPRIVFVPALATPAAN